MFFAERKILDALPKMANAAHSGELRAAFEKHEIESREHVIRLREVFRELGETPHEKYCSGLVGAIQDGQEIALAYKGTQALDAALIAMAQAVEHYEIARYGTLRTWAEQLGLSGNARPVRPGGQVAVAGPGSLPRSPGSSSTSGGGCLSRGPGPCRQ